MPLRIPPGIPEIPLNELNFPEKPHLLGFGLDSTVQRAEWHDIDVAVKMTRADATTSQVLQQELDMIALIGRHPCIVTFLGVCCTDAFYYLVFEWVERGALSALISRGGMSERLISLIAADICRGMSYMHSKNLVHRDLKPENLLVASTSENEKDVRVKIIDFGTTLVEATSMSLFTGTVPYMAPELIGVGAGEGHYTREVDMYAFAMILWQMFSRQEPFTGLVPIHIALLVTEGKRPQIPPDTPPHFKELIEKGWQMDPSKRGSFKSLIPLLQSFAGRLHRNDTLPPRLQPLTKHPSSSSVGAFILKEIPVQEIKLDANLDESHHVAYGTYRDSPVAVKCVSGMDAASFEMELGMQEKCHACMHTVRAVGFVAGPPAAIVQEVAPMGDLSSLLRGGAKPLSWEMLALIGLDICVGMKYIADEGLFIRKLKLESIQLFNNSTSPLQPRAKIDIFGFTQGQFQVRQRSRLQTISLPAKVNALTLADDTDVLAAPEAQYTSKMWAYGFALIFWQLITHSTLDSSYRTSNNDASSAHHTAPEVPPGLPPAWAALLTECLASDPDARWSFERIINALAEVLELVENSPSELPPRVESLLIEDSELLTRSPKLRNVADGRLTLRKIFKRGKKSAAKLFDSNPEPSPPTSPTSPTISTSTTSPSSPSWIPSSPSTLSTRSHTRSVSSTSSSSSASSNAIAFPLNMEIPANSIMFRDRIGGGLASHVVCGEYNEMLVAIKTFSIDAQGKRIEHERDMLARLAQCRHTVQLVGVAIGTAKALVTELAPLGDLPSYMKSRNGKMRWQELLLIAMDICEGLRYMHSQGIVHGDIKPSKILVFSESNIPAVQRVKICGFGNAQEVREGMTLGRGTPEYMAPEMHKSKSGLVGQYTHKADVYSFALVVWEMITQARPFSGGVSSVLAAVASGTRPAIPPRVPPELSELLTCCWDPDPHARWDTDTILERLENALGTANTFPALSSINSTEEEEPRGTLGRKIGIRNIRAQVEEIFLPVEMPPPMDDFLTMDDFFKVYPTIQQIPLEAISFPSPPQPLGTGSTCTVLRAQWNGKEVAVKQWLWLFQKELVLRELRVLTSVGEDSHFVGMLGVCVAGPDVFCVMHLVPLGSLHTLLATTALSLKLIALMSIDICRGMVRMHSLGFLYRDLKPTNLLVESTSESAEETRIKLSDFGMSRVRAAHMTPNLGTMRYTAPELMKDDDYSGKVDVYSFGVILWQMFARTVPFPDISSDFKVGHAVMGGNRPAMPADVPPRFATLIESCWHPDPQLRPEFKQIFETLSNFFEDEFQS